MVIVMREHKICRQINLQQKLLGAEHVLFGFSCVFENVDVHSALMLKAFEFVRPNIRKSVYARHDF
jgi:hypothetical protein